MLMQSVATRRRGMTLIELIIVIAVIVLLAIILIPAIHQARESARRTQCKNNLKQIGLALHNYHDTHTTFPPGFVLAENGIYHGWGWAELSQPFIDASPYYSSIKFDLGLQNEYNKPHMNPVIPVFRCPTDSGPTHVEHAIVVTTPVTNEQVTPGTTDAANVFARSTYFGVAGYLRTDYGGIEWDSSAEPPAMQPYFNSASLGNNGTAPRQGHRYCDPKSFGGIFGQNSRTRLKDITDGASNVIMVGERYTPIATAVNSVGHGTYLGVPDCTTAGGLAMSLGDTGIRLNAGTGIRAQTTGFGSLHRGGAHFLLADCSVRFIASDINIIGYRQVSVINDTLESDF